MKHPLIIGAGQVGAALANRLPHATVWSRANGFDLADDASWPDASGYDAAFMCAALTRMQTCESDPKGTTHINVTQTIKLLERLHGQGTHCVFLSTNLVFDGSVPFMKADAPTKPLNEYGRQKALVEAWCSAHDRCTVLRLTKVITPDMPLFENWLTGWARGEAADAFHDMTFAPVWIDDVVDALLQIGTDQRFGMEQISGAADVSYADVARQLAPQESLVNAISYRDKGIADIMAARYSSYQPTIGPARSVDDVLSLWRNAKKSATS